MKILLLDIETQPDLVWVWSVYESNAISVKQHWQLLSFAAKWVGEKTATVRALCDLKGYKPGMGDRKLLEELHALLEEADVVVAHNGRDFDIKKINARFIAHGMKPPSPYKIVDTKLEVKRVASFSSNKLDWLCRQLEIGKKIEHEGWAMWEGCMAGDPSDWAKMKKYNLHDVTLLEELFTLLRPWSRMPNVSLYDGRDACPNCGGTLIKWGTQFLRSRAYQRYRCKGCGAFSRDLRGATSHASKVGIQ